MFSHVILGANDLDASKAFYDAALGELGLGAGTVVPGVGRVMYLTRTGAFGIATPINGEAATYANGGTLGFAAQSEAEVDAFHKAGAAAGGTPIEEAPGYREGNFGKLYLAYLRDPSGNKICAMYRPE